MVLIRPYKLEFMHTGRKHNHLSSRKHERGKARERTFVLVIFRVFVIRLYFLVYFMKNVDAARRKHRLSINCPIDLKAVFHNSCDVAIKVLMLNQPKPIIVADF